MTVGPVRMPLQEVAPLLKELMIDPIELRRAQHVALTTFRCRHGTAPPDLRKKLKMDAQQEAPQESMCHIARPQPLEQFLFPIVLPLFETLFPMNFKKQVLLFVLKGSTWNCYQILILPMLWILQSIVLNTKS